MRRVSTRHHHSDRSECYQVAHNQYTENKINRRRTFCLHCRKSLSYTHTHLHYSSKFKTIFIKKSAESDRMSLSPNDRAPITAIKADDRPGAQYLSPSIHHNGEFVVNPQRGTMARVVEGGGRNLSVRMSRAESGVWPGTF